MYTCFRLVPKSMTLDDLEGQLEKLENTEKNDEQQVLLNLTKS